MKIAAITGEKQAVLIDKERPALRDGWALVKIHAAPMCAEYKGFLQGHQSHCLGHEAAGEVVEAAPGSKVAVGERVVVMPQYPCGECDLCAAGDYIYCENNMPHAEPTMAQYIAKPSWLLPRIPDGVSYERASLACCALGPSHGAYTRMNVSAFDTVLITGLGPVGLGAVLTAKYRGARVIGVEMNDYRADLARRLGADHIIDPRDGDAAAQIKALTNGKGADCGMDCSGVVSAHRLLIDTVRRRGQIAFVGESYHETPLHISSDMLRKGLTLIGSWHYNLNVFPNIMKMIRNTSESQLDCLVTHTFPMSRIQEAFEVSASGQCGKIIVKPWE
ncbi:zinc-dependent alcohol dehydrogenase [Paenibacillus mendelii]|uniref:Zinc-binding dehydrogenase n=1 Tax=Paenibacillus mendelii TaxID=206163 RepID=A0ABV6JBI5_9BACL|nr:zinc-binding dehydrogenase [Paenibacillus mendelii]MCQ6558628.1 zinc-binding dehydrogenase [Paenibacillus mendelii]